MPGAQTNQIADRADLVVNDDDDIHDDTAWLVSR